MSSFHLSQVPRTQLALFVIFVVTGTLISGAMVIEHVLGYKPCELCYAQRTGHYVALALSFIAIVISDKPHIKSIPLALPLALLALLHSDSLALYHTGVEQGLFEGPQSCANVNTLTSSNLSTLDLNAPDTEKVVSCKDPALLIFGLSLAAWNAIITTLTIMASLLILRQSKRV